MTGEKRQIAIWNIMISHRKALNDYIAASGDDFDSHMRGLTFGKMLGIEETAHYAGFDTLAEELEMIRQLKLAEIKDHRNLGRKEKQP